MQNYIVKGKKKKEIWVGSFSSSRLTVVFVILWGEPHYLVFIEHRQDQACLKNVPQYLISLEI